MMNKSQDVIRGADSISNIDVPEKHFTDILTNKYLDNSPILHQNIPISCFDLSGLKNMQPGHSRALPSRPVKRLHLFHIDRGQP